MKPLVQEKKTLVEHLQYHERVELEVVAAATHLSQYAQLHPTIATSSKQLLEGVEKSSRSFFIKILTQRVLLDKEKIQKEMDYHQKRVTIAYFVSN